MFDSVIGIISTTISAVILAVISFYFGRRKNNSEVDKNNAEVKKIEAEALRVNTDNKLAQVELFDKLNSTLTEQNERLLRSNSVLIDQNKKLLKYIKSLEDRISMLESEIKRISSTSGNK